MSDSKGKKCYELQGKWNSSITAKSVATNESIELGLRKPEAKDFEKQYFFSTFDINLNNLTQSMLSYLPATDARFRPDVRALENNLSELCESENKRLEQKSKRLTYSGHQPLWFDVTEKDEKISTRFNREYFKARDSGSWPDTNDIYN